MKAYRILEILYIVIAVISIKEAYVLWSVRPEKAYLFLGFAALRAEARLDFELVPPRLLPREAAIFRSVILCSVCPIVRRCEYESGTRCLYFSRSRCGFPEKTTTNYCG